MDLANARSTYATSWLLIIFSASGFAVLEKEAAATRINRIHQAIIND
jgi:hypothetical protein